MDYQAINLLVRCSKEFNHQNIRAKDLTDTEYLICTYLDANTVCSQDEIANGMRMDKTTIGKALMSLEKKKYVLRKTNPEDRRYKRISLTKTGKCRIEKLLAEHRAWFQEVMSTLKEKEQKQFAEYCERLLNKAEEMIRLRNA